MIYKRRFAPSLLRTSSSSASAYLWPGVSHFLIRRKLPYVPSRPRIINKTDESGRGHAREKGEGGREWRTAAIQAIRDIPARDQAFSILPSSALPTLHPCMFTLARFVVPRGGFGEHSVSCLPTDRDRRATRSRGKERRTLSFPSLSLSLSLSLSCSSRKMSALRKQLLHPERRRKA